MEQRPKPFMVDQLGDTLYIKQLCVFPGKIDEIHIKRTFDISSEMIFSDHRMAKAERLGFQYSKRK